MKTTSDIVKEILDEQDLVYYTRVFKDGTIFLLPYRILQAKRQIKIFINVDNINKKGEIGFEADLNRDSDFSEKLLVINSELLKGKLSVPKKSDFVSYMLPFDIQDSFSQKDYKKYLTVCLSVFGKLCEEELIDEDEYTYEED